MIYSRGSGSRYLTVESGKLPVGLVLSRSTKAGYLPGSHVTELQKETACVSLPVFVMELMAGTEDYGKHYSDRKATRQEIMVSRSLGSTRDRPLGGRGSERRLVYWRLRRGY